MDSLKYSKKMLNQNGMSDYGVSALSQDDIEELLKERELQLTSTFAVTNLPPNSAILMKPQVNQQLQNQRQPHHHNLPVAAAAGAPAVTTASRFSRNRSKEASLEKAESGRK